MSLESAGRLFVGIGFVWTVVVLVIGLLGGFDKPTDWMGLIVQLTSSMIPKFVYVTLTVAVVPIGMLVYVVDVLRDPAALWVKAAVPGVLLSVFFLVLGAALPDVGTPVLRQIDGTLPIAGLGNTLDATGSWLIRFFGWALVLGGIPGVVGGLVGMMGGGGGRRR
jgi:hypothetical protein